MISFSSSGVDATKIKVFWESLIKNLTIDFFPCSFIVTLLEVGINNECNKYKIVKFFPSKKYTHNI